MISKRGFFLAVICFLIFTAICYYPLSLHPCRYALSHRSASKQAMLMYYFSDYMHSRNSMPFSYCDIWAYPEGGIARVLAVPSLVLGTVLCKWISTRTTFNILFMVNLILSGLSFYLVGRKIGLKTISSIAFGLIVVFHPCLQSFILRAQNENTLLWTVGFTIFVIILLLTSKNKIVSFIASCIAPLLILFSTPYYMIFFIFLYPFLFLFLLYRFHIKWNDRSNLWLLASIIIVTLSVLCLIEYYRIPSSSIDLLPGSGSLRYRLSLSTYTSSLSDLVWPGKFLRKESPYIGFAFLFGLFFSLSYQIFSRYKDRVAVILAAGTIFFLLLVMGRTFGNSNSFNMPLLAAFIDRIYPDFQKVIKLYRAIPFMAICGGLFIVSMLDRLNSKIAAFIFLILAIFIIADNFAVRILAEDIDRNFYYDEKVDMDPVIYALPKKGETDLPVADLPPPRQSKLWQRYTYFQTEHCQKLIWTEVNPEPSLGLRGRLFDFYDYPELYQKNVEKAKMLGDELKNAGVGLIILHREFVPEEKANFIFHVLDSLYPRFKEGEKITVWRVKN